MNITADQVKKLRESTGVGMMDCKQALVENQGNMEKSILWLRERGMARAAKKAGRTAAEGTVEFAISSDSHSAAIVELNCETDFAAKNENFRAFAKELVNAALAHKTLTVEELKNVKLANGDTVENTLVQLIAKVGENMNLRRVTYLEEKEGLIAGYNHMNGKIGVLMVMKGETNDKAKTVGYDLAMHVAASAPRFLTKDDVSAEELTQEKDLARKKLEEQGKKPADIMEKIVTGQIQKFFADVCLVDQPFVKEPKISITQYIAQSGATTKPSKFLRFQLGEGIEVKEENFAEEVAAQLRK